MQAGDERPKRNAVHDLEALFWVIVQIALSICGPGGKRRPELTDEQYDPTLESYLVQTFKFLFTSLRGPSSVNRRGLFITPEAFVDGILPQFTNYCSGLKTAIHRYFDILCGVYRTRDFENLHDRILEVLADLEQSLRESDPSSSEGYGEAREEEDLRRERSRMICPKLSTSLTLPPLTAVSNDSLLLQPEPLSSDARNGRGGKKRTTKRDVDSPSSYERSGNENIRPLKRKRGVGA